MRIIGGKHKSRRIIAPKNLPVRPTTDMAKESLFNILNNQFYFDEISVLDLFAGIGSISFEFASRGTTRITSVDQNTGCVRFLDSVIKKLDLSVDTVKSDVYKYLKRSSSTKYDVIFADPPYDFTLERFRDIVSLVFENEWLAEDGLLIIEHPSQIDISDLHTYQKSKKYGGNMFSFFTHP